MMTWSNRPSPPLVMFAIGLFIAQLLIFNVGVAVFHSNNNGSTSSSVGGYGGGGGGGGGGGSIIDRLNPQQQQSRRRATATINTNEGKTNQDADGTFNGYPIHYRQQDHPETIVHCVGENYQGDKSWMHRSCEFDLLCFDTQSREYVVFQSDADKDIYKHVAARPLLDISQSYLQQSNEKANTVSLGGINLKWSMDKAKGIPRLEWFPEIRSSAPISFYELPSSVVMIPFHSMNGANPGHLVWDDFLPIFTLLTMYQLEHDTDLLMMRYILKDSEEERGLWASCDWNDEKKEACKMMMQKFLPLMMGADSLSSHELTTTEDFQFHLNNNDQKSPATSLVCAKHGVAGIGALTDHGTSKLHGWEDADYTTTHNHGRGGMIYEFRNFMLKNMGIPTQLHHKPPFRVVFSQRSSEAGRRAYDFEKQLALLQQSFHPSYVSVEAYVFSELSLKEQLEIAGQSSVFITSCGGGAVTGMFLPRGSSIIMYFPESGGIVNNKPNGKPARLDWDLFNNMSHLKVHWLPAGTMDQETDLRGLLLLIQHELDGLIREGSYSHFFH